MARARRTADPWALICAVLLAGAGGAEDAARPLGEPVLEPPTLHCLGAYWLIQGDDNANARVSLQYRPAGDEAWRPGPPLFRVEKGVEAPEGNEVRVPEGAWLFAGSVFMLEPDTVYELRLTLTDPDGGQAERTLTVRTLAEPKSPTDAADYHVIHGVGGGAGTVADPFRGLDAAQQHARPGTVLLLHAGVYQGGFQVNRSGEPGRPIVWRAAGDGEAVIDGGSPTPPRHGIGIAASDSHDVWFEGLTIRNTEWGIVANRSSRIVVRGCHFYSVDYGFAATNAAEGTNVGFFLSDNVIEGPCTWPRSRGIETPRGIQVTGKGHVICHNRIRGFADAIDTMPSATCAAIDIHHNEISEMTDDGIELDYSQRNTRCFLNRLTNVFQGLSAQPVYGGPAYFLRNALYNVGMATFKLHNSPSGVLMLHNTSVKQGIPLVLYTSDPVRNCVSRNNLFIGTESNHAYESTAPMVGCDFDYDGFGGGPWQLFLKWNDVRYATLEEVRLNAPVERHAVIVDAATAFASGLQPPQDVATQFAISVNDLRLRQRSAAVDAGQPLPGINDGFTGAGPDLGAYELGTDLPPYGPRRLQPQ